MEPKYKKLFAKIGQVLTAVFWITGILFTFYIRDIHRLYGIEGISLTFLAIWFILTEWKLIEIEQKAESEEYNLA